MQSAASSLPIASTYVPTAQSMQSDTRPLPVRVDVRARGAVNAVRRLVAARRVEVLPGGAVDAVRCLVAPDCFDVCAGGAVDAVRAARAARTYVPTPQSMQSAGSVLPVASTYVPTAQSMHSVLPVASPYVPTPQSMQSVEAVLPVVSSILACGAVEAQTRFVHVPACRVGAGGGRCGGRGGGAQRRREAERGAWQSAGCDRSNAAGRGALWKDEGGARRDRGRRVDGAVETVSVRGLAKS